MFNFEKAKAAAEKSLKSPYLELIVLGSQGSGKSFCVGTLGVPTLYLYGTRESHGPKSASVRGQDNIVPICIDYGTWKDEKVARQFTADESLEYIRWILTNHDLIRKLKVGAIAVDGLAVLEGIAKGSTEWREKCKTAAGKHNTFKEAEATQDILGDIINLVKSAQREIGLHMIVTGILDVKATDAFGAIEEAVPRMSAYGVAESMNQQFGDIVVVSKMTKNGVSKYKFQFMTDLTRVSKDEGGNQKKAMNFSPRLTGVEVEPIMDADLSQLASLKKERIK
jgi:hypothetical protein